MINSLHGSVQLFWFCTCETKPSTNFTLQKIWFAKCGEMCFKHSSGLRHLRAITVIVLVSFNWRLTYYVFSQLMTVRKSLDVSLGYDTIFNLLLHSGVFFEQAF